MSKSNNPNKWLSTDMEWSPVRDIVHNACIEFGYKTFKLRDDVTRRQMNIEFCERFAEFFGFKIVWPTAETPKPEEP